MYEILLFSIIRCLILLKMLLVLSYFLVNPSTLLKIIHKGFAPYEILYEALQIKIFHMIFHKIKYYQDEDS